MNINAHLDFDVIALEADEKVTLLLDVTAPLTDAEKSRPGQAVQVVLDRSGSMAGPVFNSAKASILKLIDRLSPQDSFGLVAFDDQAIIVVPTRTMADHHMPSVRKAIQEMRTGGQTDISSGYLMGIRELSRVQTDAGATLLLISDGHANTGIKEPQELAEIATKQATEKITTSTIGLGQGYDENILAAIAQGGGGAHRFANSIDEAIGAISAEVSDLLEKSVVNTVMRFTPNPQLTTAPRIEVLQNLPHWKEGDTYIVQLGDIYAGENRRFVIDITVPGIAALGLTTIADVTFEYTNLALMQDMTVSIPVQVNVVPGDQTQGRIADPIVRAERLVLEAQSAKSQAVTEILEGKNKDAATRLRSTAEKLLRDASDIRVTDVRTEESLIIIRKEAEEMQELAQSAEFDDRAYSSKRLVEDYNRKSRAKNPRTQNLDGDTNIDDYLN